MKSFSLEGYPDIELDLLLLYYNFSDQWGNVDSAALADMLLTKMGIMIEKTDYKLDQRHFDYLMDLQILPDIRLLLNKIALLPTPPKKRIKK